MRSLILAGLFLAALLLQTADAAQVLRNATFTSWPNGSPIRGAYGGGRDTAAYWMSKWNKSRASVGIASRLSPGYRYTLRPDPAIAGGDGPAGGETFYLRQYFRPLSASLGKRFRATIVLTARSPNVYGGWYIYPLWNSPNGRLFSPGYNFNSVGSIPLVQGVKKVYSFTFRVGSGAGVPFKIDPSHSGLATAFLFTTKRNAVVDVASFTLTPLP